MEHCPFDDKPCPYPKDKQAWKIVGSECFNYDACQKCTFSQKTQTTMPISENDIVCSICGCRIGDMRAMNRFGCPHCYEAHRNFALQMFAKCQNSPKHAGKIPAAWQRRYLSSNVMAQVRMLEEKIRKAIETENYEVAAVLKKKIDEIKQGESNA